MLTRRAFVTALAGLPVIGKFLPTPAFDQSLIAFNHTVWDVAGPVSAVWNGYSADARPRYFLYDDDGVDREVTREEYERYGRAHGWTPLPPLTGDTSA